MLRLSVDAQHGPDGWRGRGGISKNRLLQSPSRTTEHFARLKAQWEKTKPKSRCQCHACGEREGQGQNYSYLHGNHPRSLELFGAGARWDAKQTIAIAVKYPMRSAVIVISSITPLLLRNDAARTGEKLCPMSQQRLGEE